LATARLSTKYPDRIEVITSYNDRELVKRIPGSRYHGEDKVWSVPLTWPACVQLRGQFLNDLVITDDLITWASRERKSRVDSVLGVRDLITPKAIAPCYDERLYPFQHCGVDFLGAAGSSLLADEMGTGKTIQLLEFLRHSDDHGQEEVLPALVICPNSTKWNWHDETEKWAPSFHPYVITGGLVARRKILAQAAKDPLALVIINIEGVRSHSRLAPYGSIHLKRCVRCDPKDGDPQLTDVRCEVHPKELQAIPFKTVVFDEAHRMKDPRSLQTRAAWACAHQPSVVRRVAMTGTPIANDPSDLWSLMHFLEPKEFPTRSKFIDLYCLQSWNSYGGLSVVGVNPERRKEFHAIVDPRLRRMTKKLVKLQLPDKVRSVVTVEMSTKQAKAYREMESGLVTRLEDGGLMVAPTNLVAQTRLLQLAASYCEIDSFDGVNFNTGNVRMCEPSPKIDALEEILQGRDIHGAPMVVCAESRQLIELAAKRLIKNGYRIALITGGVDEYDRRQALKQLNERQIDCLLFTIKAGGTGLNMTAADTMVFLQRSWSMIDNLQAEDRVHRIGSDIHDSVQVIDIVTQGTVEKRLLESYATKLKRLDEITRDRARLHAAGMSTTELDDLEQQVISAFLGN
jgi:SNF2 family DNA or RNA helicase